MILPAASANQIKFAFITRDHSFHWFIYVLNCNGKFSILVLLTDVGMAKQENLHTALRHINHTTVYRCFSYQLLRLQHGWVSKQCHRITRFCRLAISCELNKIVSPQCFHIIEMTLLDLLIIFHKNRNRYLCLKTWILSDSSTFARVYHRDNLANNAADE